MTRQSYLFTSESVSEGHPDKVCDRISDEIVDLIYKKSADSDMSPWDVRVACETLTTTNRVVIAGEVRAPAELMDGKGGVKPEEFVEAARSAVKDIGYEQDGFHWQTADIEVLLHGQSSDIAQGVDNAADANAEGAGDQGIMFGYACRETASLMPAPIFYSHQILRDLAAVRHAGNGDAALLGPDAKSQVTVKYENGAPEEIASIVLSTQHLDETWDSSKVRSVVEPHIRKSVADLKIADDCDWHVNPTGKFVIGGPDGDAGLTGRKIIVDTYGGAAPHGGGAFSGKDTTKVDRSAAYAARYLAKNIVAADFADRCTIQLSYAIGVARPLSVYIDLHGSGRVDAAKLENIVTREIDLSPSGIRRMLDLNKPIYARTAAYGHFGRAPDSEGGFSWEKTDLVELLKQAI